MHVWCWGNVYYQYNTHIVFNRARMMLYTLAYIAQKELYHVFLFNNPERKQLLLFFNKMVLLWTLSTLMFMRSLYLNFLFQILAFLEL